ncbi:hypothetical protein HYH03_001941 [Edaphochlamys debaryana]|uniref:Glycosyltransferase family 92 protein n=1 Tax=Edaphochlamys debaryana TaxID=47281 RepID=A0A836C653_9CHLO|nr:hypothetical protein HYH03_001941 [Edaphochlamys debaryana]|eukprot:KAG2500367.1 hypothetical protein HYH03_001941 [Edaphochlamys debaryana]
MDAQADVDCDDAVLAMARPTSAELGLAPWDAMQDLDSLPARIAFLNQLHSQVCTNSTGSSGPGHAGSPRVAIFTVWNGNRWGLRRSLLPWMQWHMQQGVCRYYVLYEGRDRTALAMMGNITALRPMLVTAPLAPLNESKAYKAWAVTDEWGRQIGNHQLMAKQDYGLNRAFAWARAEGQQWLAHIDVDELIYPGTTLQGDLSAVPPWVAWVKLYNHEAVVESADVTNKYEEVTLFKTAGDLLTNGTEHLQWPFRLGTHGSHYLLYVNGKAMGRVDRGPLISWGPHDMVGDRNDTWKHPVHNPEGKVVMGVSGASLLHLTSTSWPDLLGKARSACPPSYRLAAMAGNKTKLQDCIIMTFDQEAYTAAARGEREAAAFWLTNCLLAEGAVRISDSWQPGPPHPPKCKVFRNVSLAIRLQLRAGILLRATAPQQEGAEAEEVKEAEEVEAEEAEEEEEEAEEGDAGEAEEGEQAGRQEEGDRDKEDAKQVT